MKTTERFSNRVTNYVKYRPHYPQEVITLLRQRDVLHNGDTIADTGSGTGFSSELFLREGFEVFGIEPNKAMREAGEHYLAGEKNFHSIDATAENTTLAGHSINIILAGQAFHWFDVEKAKNEFLRILKPGGNVVLIWNDRRTDSTPFLRAYEQFLRDYSTDYKEVDHKNTDENVFDTFWGKNNWQFFSVENVQDFSFDGLKGRVLSSSYIPDETHPLHGEMLQALEKLFYDYSENGKVRMEYDTKVYYGKLNVNHGDTGARSL